VGLNNQLSIIFMSLDNPSKLLQEVITMTCLQVEWLRSVIFNATCNILNVRVFPQSPWAIVWLVI
jgi:hypothetical protein